MPQGKPPKLKQGEPRSPHIEEVMRQPRSGHLLWESKATKIREWEDGAFFKVLPWILSSVHASRWESPVTQVLFKKKKASCSPWYVPFYLFLIFPPRFLDNKLIQLLVDPFGTFIGFLLGQKTVTSSSLLCLPLFSQYSWVIIFGIANNPCLRCYILFTAEDRSQL